MDRFLKRKLSDNENVDGDGAPPEEMEWRILMEVLQEEMTVRILIEELPEEMQMQQTPTIQLIVLHESHDMR